MAGGGGTRFWPLSTKAEPKQFLNLSGKDILVNETIDRQHDLMDQKDIFIVTNETQAKMMKERTAGRIAADHILAEPAARNTAACIGYAAMEILHKYGDGVYLQIHRQYDDSDAASEKRACGQNTVGAVSVLLQQRL